MFGNKLEYFATNVEAESIRDFSNISYLNAEPPWHFYAIAYILIAILVLNCFFNFLIISWSILLLMSRPRA